LELFIRLRQNTLQFTAGMNGVENRAEASKCEGGLGFGGIPLKYPAACCGELHFYEYKAKIIQPHIFSI
jgi:hypothetical protein